jgi:hypothetical protein
MAKFTFRKQKQQTGLSGVGNPYPDTTIKISGQYVGHIVAPNWHSRDGKWCIRIVVTCPENESCGWSWVQFKARFDDEPSARAWLVKSQKAIEERYTLHPLDGMGE